MNTELRKRLKISRRKTRLQKSDHLNKRRQNMLKLTVRQLVDASNSGALRRYLNLEKPMTIAWKNRKQIAACDEELKLFGEKQVALAEKHGTKDPEKPNVFVFDVGVELKPGEIGPGRKAFTAAMEELLAQPVDTIPGDPVSVQILGGKLSESDLVFLEPFLTD